MMKSYITEWKYYNHALIPANAPHEETDESFLENTHFWKEFREALFARWTASFDCQQETEWWYVIKDSVFDISKLKAKRRYEIEKGIKNFSVKRIDPGSYKEELFKVQVAAFSAYPEKYRPVVEHDSFCNAIDKWNVFTVYGAFSNEDFQLSGYVLLQDYGDYIDFCVLKTIPECERLGVNAALVNAILEENRNRFGNGFYICDGSRSVFHETAFQDYLEKYFEFRKAYCVLKIHYRFPLNLAIKVLFPFRNYIKGNSKIAGQIKGVLKMEEIKRNCANMTYR